MHSVLIAGAGKIGTMVACLLSNSGAYEVTLIDQHFQGDDILRLVQTQSHLSTHEMDVSDPAWLDAYLSKHPVKAIISCLPYFLNPPLAQAAFRHLCHYFDLTEDTAVTDTIQKMASDARTAFVPQCGLAPGFISIVGNDLMTHFDDVDTVKCRVGALPQNVNNALQYALTWSTDGLINEYGNLCHAVENGEPILLHPLEGLETVQLDGLGYEAFNTSGGLGSLAKLWQGKVRDMNYKTIRYPGHCEKMRVLMNDLRLNEDRGTLKKILEKVIPKTYQDLVIVYVEVVGYREGVLIEENYCKKIYPSELAGLNWSAIQLTTASGLCVVVDLVLENESSYQGLVYQEAFALDDFLNNRFGEIYR